MILVGLVFQVGGCGFAELSCLYSFHARCFNEHHAMQHVAAAPGLKATHGV